MRTGLMLIVVVVLFHEGVASQFSNMITNINNNRKRSFSHYKINNGALLVEDSRLAKKAAKLDCKDVKGSRAFFISKDEKAVKYWNEKTNQFLKDALTDLDSAVRNLGQDTGYVETLSVGQKRIGCAWKNCIRKVGGDTINHSGICVLGPKSTLTTKDLPYDFK